MKKPATHSSSLPLVWGLLPFVAVAVCVWALDQGLAAVAVYHGGILFCWWRRRFPPGRLLRGMRMEFPEAIFLGLCVLTLLLNLVSWSFVHVLWEWMKLPTTNLSVIFSDWGIVGPTAWIFAVYSVTVHPVLEEGFWRGMMPDRMVTDLLFAGFHLLVLIQWVHLFALPLCFLVLWGAAVFWRWLARTRGGLVLPVLTHALADLGLILIARKLL